MIRPACEDKHIRLTPHPQGAGHRSSLTGCPLKLARMTQATSSDLGSSGEEQFRSSDAGRFSHDIGRTPTASSIGAPAGRRIAAHPMAQFLEHDPRSSRTVDHAWCQQRSSVRALTLRVLSPRVSAMMRIRPRRSLCPDRRGSYPVVG
jgi:hypothetical protein